MKLKHILSISVTITIIGIGIFCSFNALNNNNGKEGKKMGYLKVKFYKILDEVKHTKDILNLPDNLPKNFDREKYIPSEQYVGYAEYKNGKVAIDVTDPDLEKALNSPTLVMGGRSDGVMFQEEFISYKPGTKEHLYGVIDNMKGYSAITYDEEETKE